MKRVSLEVIEHSLSEKDGWKLIENKWLQKRYRFPSFLAAIDFVNDIAQLSEEKDHHPFISIDYCIVTIKLTSWHAKGITDLDLQLIGVYDSIYKKI